MDPNRMAQPLLPLLQRLPTRPAPLLTGPPPLIRIPKSPPPLIELPCSPPSPEPVQPMSPCPLAQALFSPPIQPPMWPSSQQLQPSSQEVRLSHSITRPYPDVKARRKPRLKERTKTHYRHSPATVIRLKLPKKQSSMTGRSATCNTMLEGQTSLSQTKTHPVGVCQKSSSATESSREPIGDLYKPSEEELTLLEQFEECMVQDKEQVNTQGKEVGEDIQTSKENVTVDEQRKRSGCDYNRYPIVGTDSLLSSKTEEEVSVPMMPPPPPSSGTKYLVSAGYLTPPPTPPEDLSWKHSTQNMRATNAKDFSPSKLKNRNSYDPEAVSVHHANGHCLGDPTVSSTVSMSPLREQTQSTVNTESSGVSMKKDPLQRPRMFSRKGKYLAPLFKKAPVGFPAVPTDYEVECFLCSRTASGNQVYEHMFFGSLECADCSLILRTCEDFKIKKNLKGECRGSKGTHRFNHWADCPVEYLCYCVGESLSKESGRGPPSTSDVAGELGKYLRKLSLIRCFKPWKTAYSQCKEFVNSTSHASDDLERRLQNTKQKDERNDHILTLSTIVDQLCDTNENGNRADTKVESIREDNMPSTPVPEKVQSISNEMSDQMSDDNTRSDNCVDIEVESRTEDNNRSSTLLPEKVQSTSNTMSEQVGGDKTQNGNCADTEIESRTEDNMPSTPLLEKVQSISSEMSEHVSDVITQDDNCVDIEIDSRTEDNNMPSALLPEKETTQPNAVIETDRLECCLPETHNIDHLDSIVTYMAVDDNGEAYIVNNKNDESHTVRKRNPSEETVEHTKTFKTHDLSSQTKELLQNRAIEAPPNPSAIDTKDSNYIVYHFPSQKGPEECPMCYCVLCPRMFTVDVASFVVSTKCPDCELRIYIVLGNQEGSDGKKCGKKMRRKRRTIDKPAE